MSLIYLLLKIINHIRKLKVGVGIRHNSTSITISWKMNEEISYLWYLVLGSQFKVDVLSACVVRKASHTVIHSVSTIHCLLAPPTGILIVATGDTDVFGTAIDLAMEVHNVTNGQTCHNKWPKEFPINVEESSGGLLNGKPGGTLIWSPHNFRNFGPPLNSIQRRE